VYLLLARTYENPRFVYVTQSFVTLIAKRHDCACATRCGEAKTICYKCSWLETDSSDWLFSFTRLTQNARDSKEKFFRNNEKFFPHARLPSLCPV